MALILFEIWNFRDTYFVKCYVKKKRNKQINKEKAD